MGQEIKQNKFSIRTYTSSICFFLYQSIMKRYHAWFGTTYRWFESIYSDYVLLKNRILEDLLTVGRWPLTPLILVRFQVFQHFRDLLTVGRWFLKPAIVVRIHVSERVGRPTDRTTVFETVNEGAIPSRLTIVSCETKYSSVVQR